jgi:predicted RNase H-like nuclease (RuvC/YqgF family)
MSPAVLGILVPIIALMIPIVALLTQHQRKMAELFHSNRGDRAINQEVEDLRQEIQELKALIHEQSIAIDNLGARSSQTQAIESRLSPGP